MSGGRGKKTETRWLTTAEVAEVTGFAVKTLTNWRCRRKGPRFTGTRKAVRYEEAEVLRWMATREDASP